MYIRTKEEHKASKKSFDKLKFEVEQMGKHIEGRYPLGHKVSRNWLSLKAILTRLESELRKDMESLLITGEEDTSTLRITVPAE